MASSSSGESSVESTPMRIRRTYSDRPRIRKALNHMEKYNKRRATDRYWIGFFIAIFATWIVCSLYVIIHREKDYGILLDNNTNTKDSPDLDYQEIDYFVVNPENNSEFVHQETHYKTNSKNGTQNDIPLYKMILVFVEIYTSNLSHMQENLDKTTVGLVVFYILSVFHNYLYTTIVLDDNRMINRHSRILGAILLFIALIERLLAAYYAKHFSLLPSHEKLAYWVLPEIILLIVWSSKMYPKLPPKDDFSDKFLGIAISCNKCLVTVGVTVLVTIQLLFVCTTFILEQAVWGSTLFYIIAGGSFYLGLTIYYFGKMVIACTIHAAENSNYYLFEHVMYALSTVARYHFGTACYQATLIFPRLHATFIMNNSSLKTLSRYSFSDRLFFTHVTVHNFASTFTAVIGSSYSDSLRELLRYWSNEVLGDKNVYSSSPLLRSTTTFLLSSNGLILIYLWKYNQDDPSFSLATYTMYLKMMFLFNLAMKLLKVTSDATLFGVYREGLRSAADDDEGISIFMFACRYFSEFQSSDDSSESDDSDGSIDNLA